MEAVAPAAAAGIKLVLPPVINKLTSKFGGDITPAEGKYLKIVVSYRIEELIRKVKHNDSAQSMQLLEKLQAASLELVDLFDKYEYKQIEKQVSSSSFNPIKKFINKFVPILKEELEPILPKSPSRDCLEKLLKFLKQVEKIEQLITSTTDTTQPTVEMAAKVLIELALSGLFRVVSILDENFRDVITTEEMKTLNHFVDYKIEALTREAKYYDFVQLMPYLEELQAAALELEDLLGLYEYDQIEKQVNSSSSEPIPKEKVLPQDLRDGLNKLLMIVEQVENKRQSITSKTGSTQLQADTVTPTMEMAAEVGTERTLSSLFRVVSILEENFRDVKTTEEMKPLNDFVDCKIEALIREAKSDDLVQLMPSLEELQLQAAALELEDVLVLYEYDQIKKQVNSSSSEPVRKEKVLPKDLRDGLNKLLKIVERVENIRQSITSKKGTTECDIFVDFLVGGSHVPRPVIKLAISDISHLIEMLDSNFKGRTNYLKILEQLKDVVSYHIQALIANVNFDYLAQSMQLLDMLQAASLELDLLDPEGIGRTKIQDLFDPDEFDDTEVQHQFDPDEFDYIEKQISSSSSNPIKKLKPKFKEKLGPTLPKSPLRIGLEKLLKFVEQVEIKHSSITSWTDTTQSQANTITPTLRIGVEKWLKFVEQVEKEHPFITSKKGTTQPLDYTFTQITITFFPGCGFLSTRSLENIKCQEDVEKIMQNYKKNLKRLSFGWTNTASSIDTCEVVLERLEPDQNLEYLSIEGYQGVRFPNWMVKENWLPRLQTLELRSCRRLKIIPFFPLCLRELFVFDCSELMQLPPLSDTLCNLQLVDCPKLMVPLTFNKSLGRRIKYCSRNECPLSIDVSFLTNLYVLVLAGFPNLETIINLSPTLVKLSVEDCPKLNGMINLLDCTSLSRLSIFKCPMLVREDSSYVEGDVEGDIANRLPQVKYVETDEPSLVERVVKGDIASYLPRERDVKGDIVSCLPRLAYVDTDEPSLVIELVEQQTFSSIKSLNLNNLQRSFHIDNFTTLPNLEKISSLVYLRISDCPDVELLPNLPISLRSLHVDRCPKLKENYEEGGPLRKTISHIPNVLIY